MAVDQGNLIAEFAINGVTWHQVSAAERPFEGYEMTQPTLACGFVSVRWTPSYSYSVRRLLMPLCLLTGERQTDYRQLRLIDIWPSLQ